MNEQVEVSKPKAQKNFVSKFAIGDKVFVVKQNRKGLETGIVFLIKITACHGENETIQFIKTGSTNDILTSITYIIITKLEAESPVTRELPEDELYESKEDYINRLNSEDTIEPFTKPKPLYLQDFISREDLK